MNRRDFLKFAAFSATPISLTLPRLALAETDYSGRLLLTIQAEGGWDLSSFCDPKSNVSGEPEITHWSRNKDIQSAGAINYAPYGGNESFFKKYYRYMLVINGVDAQTNAHSVGVLHNWSGRNSAGYPTLTAAFAAAKAPGIPLSYLNFGGYSETSLMIRYNRLSDVNALKTLLNPNIPPWDSPNGRFHEEEYMRLIRQAQIERLERIRSNEKLMPLQRYNAESQSVALRNKSSLRRFDSAVSSAGEFPGLDYIGAFAGSSDLRRQIMLSLLAFKSGVASSGDLYLNGFDTHREHDLDHEPLMRYLTNSIDFLWDYAQEQGLADKLTVVIASDFGRTPFYNSENAKDHWPIGSLVIMEKNPARGNRVVGLTEARQNAYQINPATLKRDDSKGTIIYPKHIHKALRTYLGLDSFSEMSRFPFENTESFDFFNPNKSTA